MVAGKKIDFYCIEMKFFPLQVKMAVNVDEGGPDCAVQ